MPNAKNKPIKPTLTDIVGATVFNLADHHYLNLKLGDTFKTKGLLLGVSNTPLIWKLVTSVNSGSELKFEISYFGVRLCLVTVYPSDSYSIVQH